MFSQNIQFLRIPFGVKSLHPYILVLISLLISIQVILGQSNDANLQAEERTTYPILRPAGFLQQHFTLDDMEDSPVRFSIHRARLGVKGEFSKNIKFNFVIGAIEPPDRTPALVNGFIDFSIHPLFNLRTGQFLVPFGLEGPQPIFLNPAIERSYPTRKLNTYRMFRDIGINMHGEYSFISYSLSVLNGTGANALESINPKDVVLRVNFALTEAIDAGLSGQMGNYETDSLDTFSRNRWAAHAEYLDENGKLRIRGEFMVLDKENRADENEVSLGGYFLSGYKFFEKWEGIGRMEYYEPENSVETYYGLTLGSNYYPTKKTRLSLNGTAFTETGKLDAMNYSFTIQMQIIL